MDVSKFVVVAFALSFALAYPDLESMNLFLMNKQTINCYFAGHPDLESLEECISKGFLNAFQKDKAAIEKCPKLLKCLQRKHSDVFTFWKCMPKDSSEKECNAPLPPIE